VTDGRVEFATIFAVITATSCSKELDVTQWLPDTNESGGPYENNHVPEAGCFVRGNWALSRLRQGVCVHL